MTPVQRLIVVGGSYVGVATAQALANTFSGRFRVLLIEKNSHFQHLFAFPRFAVVGGVETHRAFIPFNPGTFANCPPGSGSVIQAKVNKIENSSVQLDRKVNLDGEEVDTIPFAFLVMATGTMLAAPSTLPGSEKLDGVTYLQKHAQKVIRSSKIVIIGAGAVGVQMATDIKELYPEKSVTLVHSRKEVMNRFHPGLHKIIEERCRELGIDMVLGSRVKLPAEGYPTDGSEFTVDLQDGTKIPADFAVIATGQVPQSGLIKSLTPDSVDEQGFIRTLKTLQISDSNHSNIFAVGDIAATAAHKAARPGVKQAAIVANNIQHIVNNEPLEDYVVTDGAGIHLTLGITKNVLFRNPPPGSTEPVVTDRTDGVLDMGIQGVWKRRGGGEDAYL